MAFGLSAGATSLLGTVAGGLLGGSGNKTSQTSQTTIDPRLSDAIYGANGSVPAAQDWYKQNKSGLNSQSMQGLNNQASQLAASKAGYDQMQNLGLGLLSGGVAGNPFSQGYTGGTNFAPKAATNTAGTNQPTGTSPLAYQSAQFDTAPAPMPTQTTQTAPTSNTPAGIDPALWQWIQEQAALQKSQQEQLYGLYPNIDDRG